MPTYFNKNKFFEINKLLLKIKLLIFEFNIDKQYLKAL